MFFELSKILGLLAAPTNVLILLGLVGAALTLSRWRRAGTRLMAAALLLLALAGFSPLGNLVMAPLEERFPPWDAARGAPDGIIVLGGALTPQVSAARGVPQLNEAAERITATVELARRYPQARLVYSGGSGSLVWRDLVEAEHAVALLERLGLPRARIAIERKARNTVENALYVRDLAQPKPGERWLLVTSAAHMPRAIGLFRKAGFPVEAYPVDYRTAGREDFVIPFRLASAGLARLDGATREWIGLLAAWLTGQSSALFPAPEP